MPTFTEEYDIITGLIEDNPIFISTDELYRFFFPKTAVVVVLITTFFLIAVRVTEQNTQIMQREKKNSSEEEEKRRRQQFVYKTAYQSTNLMVNLFSSILGSILFLTKVTKLCDATVQEKMLGYESGVNLLVCLQLGYNLWAIPVGCLFVNETILMLLHHVAVICCTFTASFLTVGCNYYTPFMFGVLEISSIPLAMMNFFKDNKSWIRAHPDLYTKTRMVFAASFLYIRWYLFYPIMLDFLRLLGMGILIFDNRVVKILLALTWIGSAFVTFLQAYWGILILKDRKSVV